MQMAGGVLILATGVIGALPWLSVVMPLCTVWVLGLDLVERFVEWRSGR
jgi:hypothetical protein